jgi:hypothetical protein
MEEPNAPEISFKDELVIWISSTAMKAPSITPKSASQVLKPQDPSDGHFAASAMTTDFQTR